MINNPGGNKIKFYHIKYKKLKIILGYCNYSKFNWYAIRKSGYIIICLNYKLNRNLRSKLLHKSIKKIKRNSV